MPDWYPEAELERHGLTPETFASPGVYALALDQPKDQHELCRRWALEYDVDPPDGLLERAHTATTFYYVGATGNLRDRLHDHVTGDKRRVKLLSVCPPTGVVDVWLHDSADEAFDHERQHAYALRDGTPGAVAWTDGGLV